MVLNDGHGQDVRIHFYHGVESGKRKRRFTAATVHLGPCAKEARPCETRDAVIGTAICSNNDPFIPVLGRKIALTRALKEAQLSAIQRKGIWEAYFIKTGLPKRGLLGIIRRSSGY